MIKIEGKRNKIRLAALFIVAMLVMCMVVPGLVFSLNMKLSDFLYQKEKMVEGEVVVIGIDQTALENLGPLPWTRDIMAEAINALNCNPEEKPAVIGIDVLYAGETEQFYDDALVEAAENGGNVVFAGAAVFGNEIIVDENGDFNVDSFGVKAWDQPFDALKAVSTVGHINAMFDKDGVIRHHLLWIDTPSGERVYSFANTIYRVYAEKMGIKEEMPVAGESGFVYLPYSVKPGGLYENISVWDLISGEVSGSDFQDKIVIIGPYEATLQDNYRTPISSEENMFGVEIQGNAVEAFLNGQWYKEVSDNLQLILLGIICLASIWLFFTDNIKKIILLWLILCPGYIVICTIAKTQGIILYPLYIPMAATMFAIVSMVSNYINASLEKKRITQTFERYVAPSVVNRLLKEGNASATLGGELVDIAVLFVDIRGFTPLSEALDPRQIVEILNEYLTLTTSSIMKTDGTLDKFIGDCTMAFWNAPLEQEDYVYKACVSAMDMARRGKALGDELEKKYGRRVDFGIGVHCGSAVVGNIGAPQRMDFTAIGDTVNTSARLEANAPAGKIYVSRAVIDALGDRCEYKSLGDSIRLKGKAEGFEVLELTEIKE